MGLAVLSASLVLLMVDLIHLIINMKTENITDIRSKLRACPSKWELDNIIWADRTTDPQVLSKFLQRIEELQQSSSLAATQELTILLELLEDITEEEVASLVGQSEDAAKSQYIEQLARVSAIEILADNKLSFDTVNNTCKLSHTDFILCATRAQELITAVQGMMIKSESLSDDVPQA
jgi:hypothetical protein